MIRGLCPGSKVVVGGGDDVKWLNSRLSTAQLDDVPVGEVERRSPDPHNVNHNASFSLGQLWCIIIYANQGSINLISAAKVIGPIF